MKRRLALLALAPLLLWPLRAEVITNESLPRQGNIAVQRWTYRSQNLQVKGLLFIPPTPAGQKRPVVIFSHDGTSGISKEHRLSCLRLAKAGYVVFAPSYRGEDGSDGMVEVAKGEVEDVLQAVELMKTVPQADTDRIALAGASHGALISLLAAARSEKVKAVVLAYGVMDIYRWWDYLSREGKVGNDAITERTYGDGPQARPQSFAIRNGLGVVDQIDCPVLVLQGKKDDIVPYEQASFLQEAMRRAGKNCQVELYPDCLHGFLVYAPYISDATMAERRQTEASWKTMLDFLKRNLS